MRRALIPGFLLLASFPLAAFAAGEAVDTYYEFGRKGSSGLVEEEDLSDEFYYSKYNVKFSQKPSDTSSWYVKYQYYDKDFDTLENIDNKFNYAAFGLDAVLYSRDGFTAKTGPDFEFKEKFYRDSKNLDYDQYKLDLPITLKKEKDWRIGLTGGINYYNYTDAPKNQFKLNLKADVSKKFFDERLELSAFYKFQFVERQKLADRLERNFGAACELRLKNMFIERLEGGFEYTMDNTIIYEEREDSYDYKSLNWYFKTRHVLFERLKATFKYINLSRNYADFNHDFGGFAFENGWSFMALDTADHDLDLKFDYKHKQFRYPYVSNPYSFHYNSMMPEVSFEKKDDWKAYLGGDIRFYDFPAKRTNDKIYYILKIGMEKPFLKKSLLLGFDYKYTFKNFLHKLDITEDVFRFWLTYKF